LPRDSRDTLFLLAVIACLIGPHWPHLPAWSIVFWRDSADLARLDGAARQKASIPLLAAAFAGAGSGGYSLDVSDPAVDRTQA